MWWETFSKPCKKLRANLAQNMYVQASCKAGGGEPCSNFAAKKKASSTGVVELRPCQTAQILAKKSIISFDTEKMKTCGWKNICR